MRIEWYAHSLQKKYEKDGPLVKLLNESPKDDDTSCNYIIIQGSFDPPTFPHMQIISDSIELMLKKHPLETFRLLILFSLAHVEKKPDVLNRSLIGERVEMIQYLIENNGFEVPVFIGLSNAARYIDLVKAVNKLYRNIGSMTFITGMDVFKKVFDPKFYSNPLSTVIPEIFKAKFLVAGRNDIILKDDFDSYLTKELKEYPEYLGQVEFLIMPKQLRYSNATQVRRKLSKNQLPNHSVLPTSIIEYLKRKNPYLPNSEKLAMRIIIQTSAKLAIEAEMNYSQSVSIFNLLIREILGSDSLIQLVKDEYLSEVLEEKQYLKKRWKQLQELTTSKN
jgi:nicotinic acid mononucleotide adenylyltransferase